MSALGDGPIVVTRSRRGPTLRALAAGGLTLMAVIAASSTPAELVAAVGLVILMMAAVTALLAYAALRPTRLVLSPLGLSRQGLFARRDWRWDEFEAFEAGLGGGIVYRLVASTVTDGPRRGQLGGGWTLPGLALVPLLNQARDEWRNAPRQRLDMEVLR